MRVNQQYNTLRGVTEYNTGISGGYFPGGGQSGSNNQIGGGGGGGGYY